MEHVVFYPSAEGTPAFARVNSLAEATSFVEHLRNSMGTTDFSVHALTPVPLAFRAYYHVELPPGEEAAPTLTAAPAAAETAPAVSETVPDTAAVPTLVAVPEPVVAAADEVAAPPVATAVPVAVSLVPDAPVEAAEPAVAPVEAVEAAEVVDEDRSEEWVAEAAHIEPPALAPVADLADVVALAPPVSTPFAVAPPVGITAVPPFADPAADANAEASVADDAAPVDEVPTPAPSGRRSMGFFTR